MYAIIGGSGLAKLTALQSSRRQVMRTPYGEPSGALTFGEFGGAEVVFLARHGYGHTLSPHEINYRANIWALKELKVEGVIAVVINHAAGRGDSVQAIKLEELGEVMHQSIVRAVRILTSFFEKAP